MRTIDRILSGPKQLTTSFVTQYIVPNNLRTLLQRVHVTNGTGNAVTFTISLGVDNGGNRIYDTQSVPANNTLVLDTGIPLDSGQLIQAKASTGSALTLLMIGAETLQI